MPDVPTLIRHRRERRSQAERSLSARLLNGSLGIGYLLSTFLVLGLLAVSWWYAGITRDLPSIAILPTLLNPENGLLLQPTRLVDRSGQVLLQTLAPHNGTRIYVSYPDLPKDLVNATLALADPGFWQHGGYRITGWQSPLVQSTLAQRLAHDLLLYAEPAGTRRAIRERLLAAQITAEFGREKVIEWFLNSASFGNHVIGAAEAAKFYFNTRLQDLDLSQNAMLAAVSLAPALNPLDTAQAAEQRRLETLQIMQAFDLAEPEKVESANQLPPVIASQVPQQSAAPAFTSLVISQLSASYNLAWLERGGLEIITTLDLDLQSQVDCSLMAQLASLAGQPQPAAGDCPASSLLPPLPNGNILDQPVGSVLVLDTLTGQVLAYSNTAGSSHSAGTLLTPFLYLTGFSRGLSPASLAWDVPSDQADFEHEFSGPVSLRTAMLQDSLAPARQVEELMGSQSVWENLASFGLPVATGSVADSDIKVSSLEVAKAYSILADQGVMVGQSFTTGQIMPATVLRLSGVDHRSWGEWEFARKQAVVSPGLAYLLTDVLSDRTMTGQNFNANLTDIGRPSAFKLGQNLGDEDAWAVGFTPERLTVAWVGSAGTQSRDQTALAATGLWKAVQQTAEMDLPVKSWDQPQGVVQVYVCDPSGMLPTAACPQVVNEVFLTGNSPIQTDTLFQLLEVNRETGLLATVFTPMNLVEKRLFINVPAFAQEWAFNAGLNLPPSEYDTILQPSPLQDASLSSPGLFADVRGQVEILGSASGEDFSYYRLEYGLGLNPQTWVQIGATGVSPVQDGLLGSWDTSSLEGLVAVRLLVVHADQRVEMAVTQVSVDNAAPAIKILSPKPGQEISMVQTSGLVIQVQVDDPALSVVRLLLDGKLLTEFSQAPFSLVWSSQQGQHTLRVEASDRAGNIATQEVNFSVRR